MSNFVAHMSFVDFWTSVLPWYAIAIAAVCAYFLGNINPAILIGKARGVDIRAQGSGNAGATNAMRSLGKREGALVFAIDVVKGWAGYYVPLMIFLRVVYNDQMLLEVLRAYRNWITFGADDIVYVSTASNIAAMLCGLCVVLGHMYPAVFGFRGGKGVATTFGVLLAAAWLYALVLLAIVIVFTLIFKRVSLSVIIAVVAAILFLIVHAPFIAPLTEYFIDPWWIVIILALIVWKHRSNIKRLVKGEEPPLDLGFLQRRKPK